MDGVWFAYQVYLLDEDDREPAGSFEGDEGDA